VNEDVCIGLYYFCSMHAGLYITDTECKNSAVMWAESCGDWADGQIGIS